MGLLGTKAFLCPPFLWLQEIGFFQPPWPSPSSSGQIQAVVNEGREGMRDKGETNSQEKQQCTLGQGPGSPWRDTHNNIFELFCSYWNPHQVGEVNYMLPTSTETPDQLEPEGWWYWLPLTSPPTNQKNVHELITPSLNHYYKNSHYPLHAGAHSFEGICPLWPPLPGKAIKLFFSTSPKTLSLRFTLVLGYRGQIRLQCPPKH